MKKKYGKALWKELPQYAGEVEKAPKPIRKQSAKRAAEVRKYNKRVKEWIVGKFCWCCYSGNGEPNRATTATQCHHRSGRVGRLLNYEPEWIPLCNACHEKVHRNPSWAREIGLLAPIGQFNNQSIVPKDYYA